MNIQSNPMHIYQNTGQNTLHNIQSSETQNTEQLKQKNIQKPNPSSDSVTFSNDAKLMAEATRVAMQGIEGESSRADKVARLKAEVQSGSYEVNEKGIAEGLLREESHFFRA